MDNFRSNFGWITHTKRLSGADLSGARLNADLDHAYLDNADLRGAKLQDTTGLTQKQIDEAMGDDSIQLPSDLQRPANWNLSVSEQKQELEK